MIALLIHMGLGFELASLPARPLREHRIVFKGAPSPIDVWKGKIRFYVWKGDWVKTKTQVRGELNRKYGGAEELLNGRAMLYFFGGADVRFALNSGTTIGLYRDFKAKGQRIGDLYSDSYHLRGKKDKGWITALVYVDQSSSSFEPVWRERLGTYTIEKWRNRDGDWETMFLKDSRRKVVAKFKDYHVGLLNIYDLRPERFKDLNRDGIPEVVFSTWSGGAHGSNTYHVWTLGRHPRCLIAYDKNNIFGKNDFEFVDLDGDRKPEVRSWYDGFSYTLGGAYGAMIPIVLKLERGRFVDRTAHFPKVIGMAMKEGWLDFNRQRTETPDWSEGRYAREPAVRLLALAELTEEGPAMMAKLKRRLKAKEYGWLLRAGPLIREIVRNRRFRYQYPKSYSGTVVKWKQEWRANERLAELSD